MFALGGADQPFPKCERLGVRVVDAKYFDAASDPEIDDAFQLAPQGAPVSRLEIERIDVLVLLRRIFGVLHAAVGPVLEPSRMLRHVGMVRRALECQVHRDLYAERARHDQKAIEVSEAAELRQDVLMASLGGTDSPGTADIAGPGAQRIVRAL